MRAPEFWYVPRSTVASALLAPAALLYRMGGRLRQALTRPWRAPIPVVCVGNLVVGGSGKTPVALAVAACLSGQGRQVHFVSRGYGGALTGPVAVDPTRHGARDVGDEPLLLARAGPTWVGRDRRAAIAAAAVAGAEVVVVDDGYQNPTFAKDMSLVVIDGARAFGNGRILPAGPLREPVAAGLKRADAVVLMGEGRLGVSRQLPPGLPVLQARLAPMPAARLLAGTRVLAFAGIADPEKFFRTVRDLGCDIAAVRAFPDHHPYSAAEAASILAEAQARDAVPVTTAKDGMRLPTSVRERVRVIEVSVAWEDPAALSPLLSARLAHG